MPNEDQRDTQVIGLYGEMHLAMELHRRGWQVYRAYIDEKFDFVVMKSYCYVCNDYTNALQREQTYRGVKRKAVTNLCERCNEDSLRMLVRFIQVKTSEGVEHSQQDRRTYSFHPKIRYHLADGRVFYAWIQVWDDETVHFFIFHTDDVERFDDIQLASYQITDNQKLNIHIKADGTVTNQSRSQGRDYSVFNDALDNFAILEALRDDEEDWQG